MNLLDLSIDELQNFLVESGFEKYRAIQIYNWLIHGTSFQNMLNIPKSLKNFLSKEKEGFLKINKKFQSVDGSCKFAFELNDGQIIESVFMKKTYGNTVCLSTQVGCKMGCLFCASCKNGFVRNLSAGEILAQYIIINNSEGKGRNITNIVLMGMGEPFDNYYEVVKFIRLINDKRSFNVSLRNISLSTCGLVDKIKLFVREQLPVNLCISLHASDDNKRKKIMPISKKWNIHEIIDAAHYYFNETGRRIIIEYIVIKNFNDSVDDVENLCNILKNINCHINLIPLNAVDGYAFESPSKKDVYRFASLLNSKGLSATVRLSQGVDILGACGQLRGSILSDG